MPTRILSLVLLALPSTALAGGFGLLGTAGLHTERAYYYDSNGLEQGIDSQQRPHFGGGLEVILGDRDDKVIGVGRFTYLSNAQATNPDTGGLSNAQFPDYDSLAPRDYGVAKFGVQWGLLGDPNGFQLMLISSLGAAFASPDALEFALAEVAPGVTYALTESIQVTGNLAATGRFNKYFTMGGGAHAGIRYMFD